MKYPTTQELHNTIFDFNLACTPKETVSFKFFSSNLQAIVDIVRKSLPLEEPIHLYLSTTAVLPMANKDEWGSTYATCKYSPDGKDVWIEVRPDLVLYPASLMKVVTQQAFKATSNETRALRKLQHELASIPEEHPLYPAKSEDFLIRSLNHEAKGCISEMRVLQEAKLPERLLPEQFSYLKEQIAANRALAVVTYGFAVVKRTCIDAYQKIGDMAVACEEAGTPLPENYLQFGKYLWENAAGESNADPQWAMNIHASLKNFENGLKDNPVWGKFIKSIKSDFARYYQNLVEYSEQIKEALPNAEKQIIPKLDIVKK